MITLSFNYYIYISNISVFNNARCHNMLHQLSLQFWNRSSQFPWFSQVSGRIWWPTSYPMKLEESHHGSIWTSNTGPVGCFKVDGNQRWAPGYPGFMNKYETASCFKPRMEILKSLKEAILEEFSFPMVFMKVGFTEWIDFERDVPEYHLDVCGTGRCLNQTCYTECPLLKYTGPNRIEKLPGVRRSNVVYCHCR